MATSGIAYLLWDRMNPSNRIMNAGPAVNAEARKRGPSSGEFQKRAGRKARKEERGDQVNAHRPDDRDVNEGDVFLLRRLSPDEVAGRGCRTG